MKTIIGIFSIILLSATLINCTELHVSKNGNNSNPGTLTAPLKTIQHAAELAQPGDIVIVHQGVYRERIDPPRGGESDSKRIIYEAAHGEEVVIKGSEVIRNWVKDQGDLWKVIIPNSFFGKFNPYNDLIHGDWFDPEGREHHTGAVYLNGYWLTEAANLDDVMKPIGTEALWFGNVEKDSTTIWAQFKRINPNKQMVEINVRQTVFYPKNTGINYITVRGFIMEHAATPWAPPTAEQIGLIGTNWSKGWIIENNVIKYSICTGISLGKSGDQWDNTSENAAEGYVKTIERAYTNGWMKESIGHHFVRNNIISHCEQAGIVGSLGAIFSTVTGNTIHDIRVLKWFAGAELAAIKFHAAIDVTISRNHIYKTIRGLWLDWMAQGTRVSENLFHDNGEDVFVEVDHGPFLMDNNLFLSPVSLVDQSQGGAYVHNLFSGTLSVLPFDSRLTPFLKPHSTETAGFHDNPLGDDRYYNNIFVQHFDMSSYDDVQLPVWMDGNVFLKGANPSKFEKDPLFKHYFDPMIKLIEKSDDFYLEIKFDKEWSKERKHKIISTEILGKASIPNLSYEQPDGSPVNVTTDYFGKRRNELNPTPGPFENPGDGLLSIKVW
ncbi:MAG: right-handed parallel beta-helix repeat-containing protein [Ignavibacteriales bacterium]|nr:right-handed parallel beta-helix repeat-containing protein [Ignavibacteriales bacterium]